MGLNHSAKKTARLSCERNCNYEALNYYIGKNNLFWLKVNKGDDKVATFFSTNGYDSVEHIPEDYDMIVKQSRELCKQIAGHEKKQILILQTADNKFYKAIVDWSADSDAAEQAIQAAFLFLT